MNNLIKKTIKMCLVLLALAGSTQCFSAEATDLSTFKAFGEKPGLVKLVDDFMNELLVNPSTKPYFAKVDQKHVKEQLVEQFCEILSGPCKYTGKSMMASHSGLGIKKHEFNALVETLRNSMARMNVPVRSQNVLLAKLAPMHKDVIEK